MTTEKGSVMNPFEFEQLPLEGIPLAQQRQERQARSNAPVTDQDDEAPKKRPTKPLFRPLLGSSDYPGEDDLRSGFECDV